MIKYIKMVNGQNIIAKVREERRFKIIICHPAEICDELEIENDSSDIFLKDWMYGANSANICLDNNNIITSSNPEPFMENIYIEFLEKKKKFNKFLNQSDELKELSIKAYKEKMMMENLNNMLGNLDNIIDMEE